MLFFEAFEELRFAKIELSYASTRPGYKGYRTHMDKGYTTRLFGGLFKKFSGQKKLNLELFSSLE